MFAVDKPLFSVEIELNDGDHSFVMCSVLNTHAYLRAHGIPVRECCGCERKIGNGVWQFALLNVFDQKKKHVSIDRLYSECRPTLVDKIQHICIRPLNANLHKN